MEAIENKLGYRIDMSLNKLNNEQQSNLNNILSTCNTNNITIRSEVYTLCRVIYCNVLQHESEVHV